MNKTTGGGTVEFMITVTQATMTHLVMSRPSATTDTYDLADEGFKSESFNYPRLLQSEKAAKEGKYRDYKDSLADLRKRHGV